MEAGPKLDALVAEKVMGLKVPGWALVQMNPECCGPSCGLVCEDDDHAEDPEGNCGLAYMKLPVYVDHCGCAELDAEEDYDYRSIERLGHYCSCLEVVPFYSEYIRAAWEVVEKLCNWDVDDNMLVLKGQGPDLEKKEWPNGEAAQWWEAEIGGTWGKVVAKAKTTPHAICLAALRAKGVEVEDEIGD